MKTNSKKIVVSTLALAMGAALAGSISGSVAWYQYSTRTTASLSGTSAGTSRNLQIAKTLTNPSATDNIVDGNNWGWDIKLAEQNLKPVSPVMTDGFPSAFKSHGVRQYAQLQDAENTDYMSFDLYFQSINEQNAREVVEVYLETFNINYSEGHYLDDALRIAITDGSHNWLLSKTAGTTVTEGQLDLNGDGINDRNIFEADDRTGLVDLATTPMKVHELVGKEGAAGDDEIEVGTDVTSYYSDAACSVAATGTAVAGGKYYEKVAIDDYITYTSGDANGSYTTTALNGVGGAVSTFSDAYTVSAGTFHFSTLTTTAAHLQVRIWLDGFAEIGEEGHESNAWSNELLGDKFSIDMRFQTVALK